MTRKRHTSPLLFALPAIGLFVLASLGGCATTMTAESCESVDWASKAYAVGAQGGALDSFRTERKCAELGVRPDEGLLLAGYTEGVADFCTPHSILKTAMRRSPDLHVCGGYDPKLSDLAAFGSEHREIAARYSSAERALSSSRSTLRNSRRKIESHRAKIANWTAELTTAPEAAKPEIRHAIVKFEDKIAKHRRRIRDARRSLRRAESELRIMVPVYEASLADVNATLRELRYN